MEGVNSFEKGLHRSNSPVEQPEGSYVDAYNWIRNDSGRLVNEDLEKIVHTFSEETVLLGHCPIKNEFICFLKSYNTVDGIWNSIIGTFSEGVYTEIFNDKNHSYKLNFTNSIDSVARVVSSGSRVTYFVERDNPIRRFDLDFYLGNPQNYNSFEDFNLQLTVKYPKVDVSVVGPTSTSTGGTLSSTVYSFVVRYIDLSNNKTSWNIPSRLVSVVPADSSALLQEADGGAAPGTTTDKKIVINISDVDLNYPLFEIGVLKYEGLTNVLVSKSLGTFSNNSSQTITFASDDDLKESIDLSNITDVPVYYTSAQSIEQKDNILLISNLTTKSYDTDFQDIANNIVVTYYIDNTLSFDDKRSVNCRGVDVANNTLPNSSNPPTITGNLIGFGTTDEFGVIDQWYGIDGSTFPITDVYQNNTNLYKDSTTKKGFQPGEIYSFSITPIYKDGSVGFAYHIPCNHTGNFGVVHTTVNNIPRYKTKAYVSQVDYPINSGYPPNTGIRHHELPYDFDPVTYVNGVPKVNILRVSFHNISIPDVVKSKIQGYIIGYQERNKDSNKRVIDEGIAIPYLYWSQNQQFYNSFLNGCGRWSAMTGSGTTSAWAYPYAMYYSPNTELGLEIKEGYSFHVWKYSQNYYYNNLSPATDKYFTNKSILRHVKDGDENRYDVEFFDGNKFKSVNGTKAKISKTEKSPNVGIATQNAINGKFNITGSSTFTHIECTTSSPIFDSLHNTSQVIIYPQWTDSSDNVDLQKQAVSIKGAITPQGNGPASGTQTSNTAMVRITNEIDNQYGNLQDATYAVAEIVQDINSTSLEVEGDTYYYKHWYNIRTIVKTDRANRFFQFDFIAGIWHRSQNNLALRHGESGDVPYYPKEKTFFGNDVGGSYSVFGANWWERSLGYNRQYSAANNFKENFPKPLLFSENTSFQNRTIYSKQAFESELSDQYRVFPTLQFHDIPKDRGTITDTFVFNNNFYHHTEYGLWLSYFNPNTTQATSQGQVVLGNAGLFTIPSKLILDIKGGYMGTLDKSGINTPFGRIFIDHSQKKVFLFDGAAPVEISDLGLFSFFRDNISKDRKFNIGYDWKNKRVLLSLIKEYSNDLSTVVNNGPVEEVNVFSNSYTTLSTAKNLGELIFPIKMKTYKDIFFKVTLEETKYIILDLKIANPCTLNIYKKMFSGDIELFKTQELPSSTFTDTVYNPGTNAEYVVRTYNFYRLIEELEKGEYYIEVSYEGTNTFLREINLISRVKEYPSEFAMSYYPKTNTWTSLHNFAPSSYLTINSSSYAWKNNSFYNLSNEDGIKKNSYITLVTNSVPDAFKRFDRMEVNTMSGGVDGKYSPGSIMQEEYTFLNESFTTIHCWTDRQNSTNLPLAYSDSYEDNFLNGYDVDKVPVNYYRSSFHLELPLDAVVNPYKNIFDPENLDLDADFRSHLKGKFLYTKLSYNKNTPLVLNYIKTFFKPSVA